MLKNVLKDAEDFLFGTTSDVFGDDEDFQSGMSPQKKERK